MKTSIKTLSITISELRTMLAEAAASGTTDSGEKKIEEKIREKSQRLSRQRESRRQRREQQQKEREQHERESRQSPLILNHCLIDRLIVPLNKTLAKSIGWIHNRREHLRSSIACLIRNICHADPDLHLDNIINAFNNILDFVDRTHKKAALYLSPNPLYRPYELIL